MTFDRNISKKKVNKKLIIILLCANIIYKSYSQAKPEKPSHLKVTFKDILVARTYYQKHFGMHLDEILNCRKDTVGT